MAAAILKELSSLGVSVEVEGTKLLLRPGSLVPPALASEIRTHKAEVVAIISQDVADSSVVELFDLPFPTGYDGLPRAQVEMALAWLDKVGVYDPILHKYNVISWVRSHLQWHGQNRGELYEAIKSEQLRLGRILDLSGDPEGQGTSLEGNEP